MIPITQCPTRSIAILFLLSVSVLSISCGSKCDPPPPIADAEILDKTNATRQTDVYLDGTLSMQGFTNMNGDLSIYQRVIPVLERIAPGDVTFWKFGNEPKAIGRSEYLQADKPAFYPNSKDLEETRIQKVLQNVDTTHLTVIVTDLFQESADINQLISTIKEKFIKANISVGIMGVKSQFDGTIYDVGTNNRTFRYASGGDPQRFRPFYMLVLGSHAAVSGYFDKFDAETASFSSFENKETGFTIKKRIIYSRYLTDAPASLIDAKVTPNNTVAKMAAGFLVKTNSPKNPFREFTVGETADGTAFTAEIPINILTDAIDFGPELSAEIQPSTCGGRPATLGNEPPIIVEATTPDKKKIQLSVRVIGRKLPARTTNVFRIILRPRSYVPPGWVADWNMTGEEVERWFKSPNDFKGSRTHNLSQFLDALWVATEEEFRPKVADFYFYMKRG